MWDGFLRGNGTRVLQAASPLTGGRHGTLSVLLCKRQTGVKSTDSAGRGRPPSWLSIHGLPDSVLAFLTFSYQVWSLLSSLFLLPKSLFSF